MSIAPLKKKDESSIKPIDPISKAKNDLNRRREEQPNKDKNKEKPLYDINNPPEGYA